jgi:hypothetical protein
MTTAVEQSRCERLRRALKRAGLSVGQAAKKLRCTHRVLANLLEDPDASDFTLGDWVELAQLLLVDPRWLMRGLSSPAAIAAVENLRGMRKRCEGNLHRAKQADFDAIIALLETTPQPDLAEPDWEETCRYCGCTPDNACAEGCEWVDRKNTICSACLQPAAE